MIIEVIPLGNELIRFIRILVHDSFKWTGLSKFRKSYIFTDAPTATIKSDLEREMDSTSAPIFIRYTRGFAERISQDIIFLSKLAENNRPATSREQDHLKSNKQHIQKTKLYSGLLHVFLTASPKKISELWRDRINSTI